MIWKIAKLGDICKIQTGNSIPVKEKKVLYKNIDEGLPYVATKDVGFDGVINYDNGVRIPPIHSSKFKLSKKNSILVCGEGGSAGRKIAFSNKDCYFVNKLFSICSVTETVPKYVYYYALSNEFQNQFKNAMNGLIGGVSLSKIRDFQITYPSISEQHRIIAKLDAAFAEIDKTIYTDEQKLLKINLLKQTLLKFEFNIDAEKTKLGEVVKYDKQNGQGSKLPYIGMENISKETMRILGKIKVPEKTSSTFKFNNSHVLFGRLRPYLKKVLIPNFEGQCSTEIFCLKPSEKINKNFLAYWLLSPNILYKINNSCTGARMPRANMKELLNYQFPVLPLSKQQQIVTKIDKIFGAIDSFTEITEKKIANYHSLKLSILSQEIQKQAA